MNEVWKRIFEGYIESYNAIETLKTNILDGDDEDYLRLKMRLLDEIIETFKSEV